MGLDTFAARSPDEEELTEEDLKALEEADVHQFFRVCAERNLGLIGWW